MSCYIYNKEIGQVVCIVCRFAVLPARLQKHLAETKAHSHVPLASRQEWAVEYADQTISDIAVAASQPHGRREIEHLAIVDGYECETCGQLNPSQKRARQHRVEVHGERGARGQAGRKEVKPWRPCQIQSVFPSNSPYHHWFRVERAGTDSTLEPRVGDEGEDEGDSDPIESIRDLYIQSAQKRKGNAATIPRQIQRDEGGGWLGHMGWGEHLGNKDIRALDEASRLPDRDEQELKVVVEVVAAVIERCIGTLANTTKEVLQWWRSPQEDHLFFRPLARVQTQIAWEKYTGLWKRLFCFYTRGIELDEGAREHELGMLLSKRQEGLLRALQQQAQAALHRQDESEHEYMATIVLDFAIDILQQHIWGRGWENPLIHFTSILGCNGETGQLRSPQHYTGNLAGLVYCSRLLHLQRCQDEWDEQHPDRTNDDIGTKLKHFMDYRSRWLTNGSFTPMSRMLGDLAFGMSRQKLVGSRVEGRWEDAERRVYSFQGVPIVLQRVREMVHECVEQAEDRLWRELLFVDDKKDRFEIKLGNIIDDMSTTKVGWSFVSDPRNSLTWGFHFVLDRIQSRPEVKRGMFAGKEWKASALRQYQRAATQFLEDLFVLVHLTAGQPARGPEIGGIRHRDGVMVDRNIFVTAGQVTIITQYHKSIALIDAVKTIPRFLPARVSQLVVVYLACVQPFLDETNANHTRIETNDWLWSTSKGPWETDKLTNVLARRTEKSIGVRFTISSWRHIAVAISRDIVHPKRYAYTDEADSFDEDGLEVEWAPAIQTAHSSGVRESNYGVLRTVAARIDTSSLDIFRGVSVAWHRWLGLESTSITITTKRAWDREEGTDTSLATSRTNRDSLDRPAIKRQRSTILLRAKPPKLEEMSDNELDQSIQTCMQQTWGYSHYTSREQGEALRCVLRKVSPLVVILPTGGGKSLLFMLPPILEPWGTTIIVMPFISLVEDMLKRCREAGIDCIEWSAGEGRSARLVLVGIEKAQRFDHYSDSLLAYAQQLASQGSLNRICFDESHTLVIDQAYRDKMTHARRLRMLEVPVVFLTATLPPSIETELEVCMLIPGSKYIRNLQDRANIAYIVYVCRNGKSMTETIRRAKQQHEKLEGGQRGVIYCKSRRQTEQVAALLEQQGVPCGFYHAGMEDRERSEAVERWRGQPASFIAATTALGTGIEIPGLTVVIHLGTPFSTIDYAQESGRCGRRGEPSDAIIVVEDKDIGQTSKLSGFRRVSEQTILDYISQNHRCRRTAIYSYMHGRGLEERRCQEGDIPCDICTRQAQERTAQAQRLSQGRELYLEAVQRETTELEKMEKLVKGVGHARDGSKLCPTCFIIRGEAEEARHGFMSCQKHEGLGWNKYLDFGRLVRWPRDYTVCIRCGIWHKACERGAVEKNCAAMHAVIPIAMALRRCEDGRRLLDKVTEGRVDYENDQSYAEWLVRRYYRAICGQQMVNAHLLIFEVSSRTFRS